MSWKLVDLAHVVDERGTLTAFEVDGQVPFTVRRLFYLRDVPPGAVRGGHAQDAPQFVMCITGSVEIHVDDGRQRARLRLDDPSKGLSVGPLVWVEVRNFSPDAVVLVVASEFYDPAAVIHDHARFLGAVRAGKGPR